MKKKYQKIKLLVLLFLLISSFSFAANSIDIKNITNSRITIEINIDSVKFEDKKVNNIDYQIPQLPGLEHSSIKDEEEFQLPVIPKMIGVPPEGYISVNVTSSHNYQLKDKSILYNPKLKDDNGMLVPDYSRMPEMSTIKGKHPGELIEKEILGFVGNRRFASVKIFPLQYNSETHVLTVYDKISLSVRIHGKTEPNKLISTKSYIDEVAPKLVVNNDYSKYWRKEREQTAEFTKWKDKNEISSFKMYIAEKGIYKVTYSYLNDTLSYWQDSLSQDYIIDFDVDELNPKNLGLFHKGEDVPIYFYGEDDGSFDEGDYFEFYADINHGRNSFYDHYSLENCFVLKKLSDKKGARLAVEDGGIYETDPREYTEPYYYDFKVHFEEQLKFKYLSKHEKKREDYWFWAERKAPSMSEFALNLKHPLDTNARRASVLVNLMGQTYYESGGNVNNGRHHVQAFINDAQLGSSIWSGQNEAEIVNSDISNQTLKHGENSLYISMPDDLGADVDKVLLDYVEVEYWREFIAYKNYLEFHKPKIHEPGLFQFRITQFDTTRIDVYKPGISKFENLSIESSLPEGGPPFILTFQDQVYDPNTKYIAITDDEKLQPERVVPRYPSNLKNPQNQADYIVISKRNFLQEDIISEFTNNWYLKAGLNVKPVSMEAIFDEFNGGIRSAYAIRDFLKYAYNNWQTPSVKYVLLIGEGCQDEKTAAYSEEFSIIPVKYSWSYDVGATVDDNFYACIVGDDELPDLVLSRIPIWQKEQLAPTLQKTIQYHQNPNYNDAWRNHVVLIAGGNQFINQNERLLKKYITDDYRVSRVYPSLSSSDPYWGSTTILKDHIDDGTAFIQFMGHGGGHIWSDLNIMDLADISTLFNDNYPVITSLTCYTSNFVSAEPKVSCLGQKFIIEPEKGAIGFFGGAGKGFLAQDEDFEEFVLNNLTNRGMRNFALVNNIAKIEYYLNNGFGYDTKTFVRAFNYLGDPAIKMPFPTNKLQTNMNSHQFVEGDTAKFYVNNPEDNLDRVAYYVADEERLIPSPQAPEEMQQVELYNIQQDMYRPEGYKYYIDTTYAGDEYEQIIHTYAYNDTADYMGHTKFMVGNAMLFDIHTKPENPLLGDSIRVHAKICSKDGVDSARVAWWLVEEDMHYLDLQHTQDFDYQTEKKIDGFEDTKTINYKVQWWETGGEMHESEEYRFTLQSPDLQVIGFHQSINEKTPAFKIDIRNTGEVDFPPESNNKSAYKISIYNGAEEVSSILTNKEIGVTETADFYLSNNLSSGNYTLTVIANSDTTYLEDYYSNNMLTEDFDINNHLVTYDTATEFSTIDLNGLVKIPAGTVNEDTYFYFNNIDSLIETNQPDLEQIPLESGEFINYELGVYDSSGLANDNKLFKDVEFKFNYLPTDTIAQTAAENGDLYIYRYNSEYSQWIQVGGLIDLDEATVSYPFINKLGIYSIFYNKDKLSPAIDANVEGQEFTKGEFVDKQATFSLIVQDRNGVNPASIELLLDGEHVDDYTLATEDINAIPLQYQIDVQQGSHTFLVSATDNNGNYKEEVVNFSVQEEFKIINIGNYPNPVSSKTSDPDNEGRTRFTYTLTTAADDVRIKIFTVSGRLVNELKDLSTACGYHEYPRATKGWNCVDFDDRKLANGVYFYKVIAKRGSKTIEKIEKMAILR